MAKALKPPKGSTSDKFMPFSKAKQKQAKDLLGLTKPKVDTSAQDEILAQQRVQQAELDSEENRRRKRLLAAATGVRAYAGSPMFRAAPSNSAGRAASAAAAVSSGSGSGGGGYARSGGSGRGGSRSMIP